MEIRKFRSLVLGYWGREGRHYLPWRHTRDPYKILVSEVMLQQTRVDRVISYYERFLKRFPTVQALARAPLTDVLRAWSGLGYNRRAKYLHDAAKQLVLSLDGRPKIVYLSYDELRRLPGVGDYTAKAVRVFAFNEPEVLIETNIRAVLIHHFFPLSRKVSDEALKPILKDLNTAVRLPYGSLTAVSPREWYSALMDYGSHIKQTHPNPSRRSKHHVKQSKFNGSLRQVRGALLRAYAKGENLNDFRSRYKDKFSIAMISLVREGLITRSR